ncbi:YdeI/OmpD-associated family protein [Gemmatimonas sp.]|uniref:YdeI/OmpD-associated family protein n=1 Tax=Gemmatimonas sp. TaxID=1962908 RepID=UPI00398308B4
MVTPPPTPPYFASADDFRRWLETHHDSHRELVVGFHKVGTDSPSMTWTESVREALCFGWIDGVRRRVDEARYSIRFTPRKTGSIWSAVNLKHVESLLADGRMHAAGQAAYEARTDAKSKVYAFEQAEVTFSSQDRAQFAATPHALAFFERQPPSYRKTATWWVISAKQPATRARRLSQLIACSGNQERLPQYTR